VKVFLKEKEDHTRKLESGNHNHPSNAMHPPYWTTSKEGA
jgi:hypothetical protein